MTKLILQGAAKYPVREVVVHCAATPKSWMEHDGIDAQVAEIRRWHMQDRGWKDIGYHWIGGRKGEIRPGRAETVVGAGVKGHNRGVIHICLIGGAGSVADGKFDSNFTKEQDSILRHLLLSISQRTEITRVSGHNEWASKACPGFYVPQWLDRAGIKGQVLTGLR